jgi:hypothetical protein
MAVLDDSEETTNVWSSYSVSVDVLLEVRGALPLLYYYPS